MTNKAPITIFVIYTIFCLFCAYGAITDIFNINIIKNGNSFYWESFIAAGIGGTMIFIFLWLCGIFILAAMFGGGENNGRYDY